MFRYTVDGNYHVREDFAIPVLNSRTNKIWSKIEPARLVTPNVDQDSRLFPCNTKLKNTQCKTDKFNLTTCEYKYECVPGTKWKTTENKWQKKGPKCPSGFLQTEDRCCPKGTTHLIKEEIDQKVDKYCAKLK